MTALRQVAGLRMAASRSGIGTYKFFNLLGKSLLLDLIDLLLVL